MPPTLTIITPVLPYPARSGGSAHVFQMVKELAEHYTLDLYTLTSAPGPLEGGPLAEWCRELRGFRRSPAPTLTLWPPAVRMEHSDELRRHLRARLARTPPEILQLEFTVMAQYAREARPRPALIVCTAHNVGFLAQARAARQEPRLARKARRWAGALSLWLYELLALRHCDLVITHGQQDLLALRRWLPGLEAHYVPSGVSLEQWPDGFNPQVENRVLFVGNFLHPPNVQGALWLAREVWPFVRRQQPEARLVLVGRAPPPEVQALAAADIEVTGEVPELRSYYADASVVAAPIFWGSGVRIKLLEALACGVPVVTTALAAEGIALRHGESALFAERAEEFAAAIVQLLESRQQREALGRAGRAVVVRDYDWRTVSAQLVALYEQARNKRKQTRG